MESEDRVMQNVIKEEPAEFVLILPSFEIKTEQATKLHPNQNQAREKPRKLKEGTQPTFNETRKYQCGTCSKSYKTKKDLTWHGRIHNDDEFKFHCDLCEYKTCYKRIINLHMVKHTTDYNHKCPDCIKFFKDTNAVKTHQKLIHSELKLFKCSKCEVTKSNKSKMRIHEKTVHSTQRVKCQLCGSELKHSETLKKHMKNKHGGDKIKTKRFQCDICGAFKSEKHEIKLHLSRHFDSLKVKCSLCEKTYVNQQNLSRHLSMHRNEIFHCQLCSKTFKSVDSLRYHQNIHSDVKHPCSQCNRSYETKRNRIRHEARMHYQGEKRQCPKCQKQLKNPETLRAHLITHEAEFKFECNTCKTKYHRKSFLKKHNLNVHGEHQNLKCKKCFKLFKNEGRLKNHLSKTCR